MEKTAIILTITTRIITVFIVVITLIFVIQKVDRYLELKAIEDCAQTYRLETTNGKSVTVRPLEKQFRECVWNKGVKSWQETTE